MGYIRTEKHKRLFQENLKKWRENNREAFIEIARKNRLKKPILKCKKCGGFVGKKEHKCIVQPTPTPEQTNRRIKTFKEGLLNGKWKPAKYWKGKTRSETTKQKISFTKKEKYRLGLHKLNPKIKKGVCLNTGRTHFKKGEHKGKKSWNWRGGITPKNKARWCSVEYQSWRKKIFERDNYTCQNENCDKSTKEINAHHIIPIFNNPKLIYDINNGKTLCVKCHKQEHKRLRNEAKK